MKTLIKRGKSYAGIIDDLIEVAQALAGIFKR